MKIEEFNIELEEYSIPCKLYTPEGNIKRIVLGVHGFAGDKESSVLAALAERLSKKDAALICFDFPGHGKSSAPYSCLRVENCIRSLLEVVKYVKNHFPESEYGIFATSFGGYITLVCSEKLKDFRIVLRAPAITMANSFVSKIIPVSKEQFIRDGGAVCGFERKIFVSTMFYEDLLKYQIRIPTEQILIIHGTEDDIIPYSAVEELANIHKNIKLISIEDADHRFKKDGQLMQIVENTINWLDLNFQKN